MQDACGSSDEEDELTDALGVLELTELGEANLKQVMSRDELGRGVMHWDEA